MKLIRLILRRPTSVILMILAVVVFGSASLTGMPLEYMPDLEMPMELVMVTWPGADADSIDRLVTQPIEDECETLSDIDSVNSYSFDNYAMLQLTYKYGVDMDEVYSDLKNSMDNLMPTLPEDCEDPLIMELSADFMPTMILSAVAPEGMDAASMDCPFPPWALPSRRPTSICRWATSPWVPRTSPWASTAAWM